MNSIKKLSILFRIIFVTAARTSNKRKLQRILVDVLLTCSLMFGILCSFLLGSAVVLHSFPHISGAAKLGS